MTSLYKIAGTYHEQISAMMAVLDDDSGDVTDKMAEILNIKEFAVEKQQNIAAYVLNIESDIEQMDAYISAMKDRKESCVRKAARLKDLIKWSMTALEQSVIKCDEFTIALKNTPGKVVINNEALIPEEFKRTKTVIEPDKVKIADELKKEDGHVPGCHFEKGKRLEIK
jgi:C4-type Zn-finger protein